MNPVTVGVLVWVGLGGLGLFLVMLAAKKNPTSEVGRRLNSIVARNTSYVERRARNNTFVLLACLLGPLIFVLALIIYTGYGQDNHP